MNNPELLTELASYVRQNLGLHYAPEKLSDIERIFLQVIAETGHTDLQSFADNLFQVPLTPQLKQLLVKHLTIGETYFFRERRVFDILPQIIDSILSVQPTKEKSLRIWCAGCSSGEEPFSIAIFLREYFQGREFPSLRILATDINEQSLEKARKGIYREWSFRGEPLDFRNKYFTRLETGEYRISDEIKSMVEFAHLNLFEDNYPSILTRTNATDIIFCRNVIMYFDEVGRKSVLSRFFDALNEKGILILSLTEVAHQSEPRFRAENYSDITVFRRDSFSSLQSPPRRTTESAKYSENVSVTKLTTNEVKTAPIPEHSSSASSVNIPDSVTALLKNHQYSDAITFLRNNLKETRKNDSSRVVLYKLLIKAEINNGSFLDAMKTCDDAIREFRLEPSFYYSYAIALMGNSRYDEAVTMLKKCLYIEPAFVAAHITLAQIYKKSGKLKEQKRAYELALEFLEVAGENYIIEELDGLNATEARLMIIQTLRNTTEV